MDRSEIKGIVALLVMIVIVVVSALGAVGTFENHTPLTNQSNDSKCSEEVDSVSWSLYKCVLSDGAICYVLSGDAGRGGLQCRFLER